MATTSITASSTNTPQAKDDVAAVAEGLAIAIDVMANDLGGAAKHLYSVDQSNPTAPQTAGFSKLGATVKIIDGKIYYDAAGASTIAHFKSNHFSI